MIRAHVRSGLQTQSHGDPVAFYQSKSTFVLLTVPGAFNEQEVQQSNEALVSSLESQAFSSADEFEAVVSNAFHSANLTLSFSIAIVTLRENIAYLKTFGTGSISLDRDGRTSELVARGSYGKGAAKLHDTFSLLVGEAPETRTVSIEMADEQEHAPTETTPNTATPSIAEDAPLQSKAKPQRTIALQKKYVLYGAIAVIGILLVWNIFSSYTSKTAQEDRALIAQTQEIVEQKLEQAKDVFELNAGRSSALIAEAKRDVDQLEKQLHAPHQSEITALRAEVATLQGEIVGNAKIAPREFLDLSLESKDAVGTQMWLYDDTVAVLDPRGTVYLASLEKKTLRSIKSSVLARASLVALTDDSVLFYKPQSGIGRITIDGEKKSVVVKNDADWQSIVDMKVYNNNIYLLDAGKGQIWKYLPTEDGYASKSAYFQSEAYAIRARSFAFDQSIYVAQAKLLTKYTSGLQDGFSPQYPGAEPMISRVITSSDDELVYVWDKEKGVIISLTQDGAYQRTYEADLLKKAASVEVYQKNAYALLGPKLYQLPLK